MNLLTAAHTYVDLLVVCPPRFSICTLISVDSVSTADLKPSLISLIPPRRRSAEPLSAFKGASKGTPPSALSRHICQKDLSLRAQGDTQDERIDRNRKQASEYQSGVQSDQAPRGNKLPRGQLIHLHLSC
jgi:hypothetical protein